MERNLDLMQQYLRLKQDVQDTQQRYLQDIEHLEKERQGLLIRNQLVDEVYPSGKVKEREKLLDVIGKVMLSFICVRAVADVVFKNELLGK